MSDIESTGRRLRAEHSAEHIMIFREGAARPLLTHHALQGRKPFIHPVVAPDGNGILTEDGPAHHPWQRGIYCGFNDVNGIGFWEEGIRGKYDGSFQPEAFEPPEVRGHQVTWSLNCSWLTPEGGLVLREEQDWCLADRGDTYELDLVWRLQAEQPLVFHQHMCGGLFLRMPYVEKRGGVAVSSAGRTGSEAEKQRARWVTVHMPIKGREDWAGMAIMDHPDNADHPVTWRVDGELGISPSRCIAGDWTVPQGGVEELKYRLLIYCGRADVEQIEASYWEFADT